MLMHHSVHNQSYSLHVSNLLAETRVAPALRSNSLSSLLHESQAGTIFSPDTEALITWAPRVASFEQPFTEHLSGHDIDD